MPKVEVKDGDLELALRKFKRVASETKRSFLRHEYHLRKGIRRREKQKAARKRLQKKSRMY
ncbi:30S ribosomal protein S21 [Mycoplasma sp. E35C]|uniref:30S ribosomal protein S21 n=1 Tax=Mycoplasma sp. E35C TaxID=2801918 RepID=UPI001CA3C63A|nr:30S ribosomal protein S21 [Mycoplasma sp. E35C]QZX49412.1 30S ribosomal protein S21 [Mycoplasma sp. E35C]